MPVLNKYNLKALPGFNLATHSIIHVYLRSDFRTNFKMF